jgi:hypothetical protein
MLPDASDRLKWTYGVSAFQQWCAQQNRSSGIAYSNPISNYSRLFKNQHYSMSI